MKGGKNETILLVEDDAVMRESIKDWLTDIGYQVETAEDGEQALKTFGEQEIGFAILDLRLPGKDGLEVLRAGQGQAPPT